MKKIIVANWKMNPVSLKEAQKMMAGLKAGVKNNPSTSLMAEVVVCSPFVYLAEAKKFFGDGGIKTGSQNCFWENHGAFTGEVSPVMLKDLGVRYVILGHSERVMVMGETNDMTAKKVKAVLLAGLIPIICIGGDTFQIIEKELKECLKDIKKQQAEEVIIAYEPLWAISTNQALACSPDDALTMALFIKKLTGEIYGKKVKENIKVLYGGNVSSSNASG